jgi:hypothetical protein
LAQPYPSQGAVFKITPSGLETALYSFTGGTDGGQSQAALIQRGDGKVYGTTLTAAPVACVRSSVEQLDIDNQCSAVKRPVQSRGARWVLIEPAKDLRATYRRMRKPC